METDENNLTESKLFEPKEMEKLDMGELCGRFLQFVEKSGSEYEKITIFRSGYMLGVGGPAIQTQVLTDDVPVSEMYLREQVGPSLVNGNSAHAPTQGRQAARHEKYNMLDGVHAEGARQRRMKSEIDTLKDSIKERGLDADVSYVTLSEDHGYHIQPKQQPDSQQQSDSDCPQLVPTYFNVDTQVFNAGNRSVRVHRTPGPQASGTVRLTLHGASLDTVSHARNAGSSSKLSKTNGVPLRPKIADMFSHEDRGLQQRSDSSSLALPLAFTGKPSRSFPPATPLTRTPSHDYTLFSQDDSPHIPVGSAGSLRSHKSGGRIADGINGYTDHSENGIALSPNGNKTNGDIAHAYGSKVTDSEVSDPEITRLARLWVDDRLELYDTKWPVPTHLAHLATKRAMVYLNAQNGGADAKLPDVHPNICDTLYYL